MDLETFEHAIRQSRDEVYEAEVIFGEAEAKLAQLIAKKKTEALANGLKSAAAAEIYADASDDVFNARLAVATAKAALSAAKIELKAREADAEQWKAKLYAQMREQRRYGA